jgi:hypothetical protein
VKITYILTNKVPNLGRFLCNFDEIKIITSSEPIIIWGVLVGGILEMGAFWQWNILTRMPTISGCRG